MATTACSLEGFANIMARLSIMRGNLQAAEYAPTYAFLTHPQNARYLGGGGGGMEGVNHRYMLIHLINSTFARYLSLGEDTPGSRYVHVLSYDVTLR